MDLEPKLTGKKTIGRCRSNGGCLTCRIRRVKCDESKPYCLRCTRTGRHCDGYEKKTTPLLRNASSKVHLRRRILAPLVPEPCPMVVPFSIRFPDEETARYFRFFYHETADALAGGFDSPLWKRIVFQACHESPAILNCAVAIAALDRASRAGSAGLSSGSSEVHHRYALSQYSKALKGVRESICSAEDSLRTTLIASLLIFCFENFHGDVRLALANVRSAQELMHNWLESKGGSATPRGFSPAPYIIEDELVHAFAKLDVHLLSWIDVPTPTLTPNYSVPDAQSLPTAFCSTLEAKYYFDIMATRICHHLATVQEDRERAILSLPTPPPDVDQSSKDDITDVEVELLYWISAFEPLLKHTRRIGAAKDFINATILSIHAKTLEISVRAAKFDASGPSSYDVFLPEYCEIVSLCQAVANHPRFVRSYVYDVGIVPVLFLVVVQCRDTLVRREAIAVLKTAGPRREGLWDSITVAKIGEILMSAEEENTELCPQQWNDIHLRCLNICCRLPSVSTVPKVGRQGSDERICLLDWVESRMKINAVTTRVES